ncbi:putative DNA modification/repair radical SAM protein [Thermodesulfobacterium thermophilum]|uniref:putative DNA modification/repair radical SAM protein n=1 Tax=Thermodesulfobacterium thermophilum TaxID=886 RepID=UPI0004205456|nr:putative DNA modification/repair radical SAM protein [Thermodesulfobacterium thermophilum]
MMGPLVKKKKEVWERLELLAQGAKFDVSCASSGVTRNNKASFLGNASRFGICHTFTSDGRCISLLKVLLTNQCHNDCAYCVNKRSNHHPRTFLSPEELAYVTYQFYRRNYIEGLFLSSGIIRSADYTLEKMIDTVKILRRKYGFDGYIHLKILPGASEATIVEAIRWADRVSVNLELPTPQSLVKLAPEKNMKELLSIIELISKKIDEFRENPSGYNAKGGQSTQLIVGASPESDLIILTLSQQLYKKYKLKRVYYSAYIPVNQDSRLPAVSTPPLIREHRLYQADWLIRFYGFTVDELLSPDSPNLEEGYDPKLAWALRNLHYFPVDIMKASYYELLRVPGIGPISAKRILNYRKHTSLSLESLKKLGVVIKRAKYFITINGKMIDQKAKVDFLQSFVFKPQPKMTQLELFF